MKLSNVRQNLGQGPVPFFKSSESSRSVSIARERSLFLTLFARTKKWVVKDCYRLLLRVKSISCRQKKLLENCSCHQTWSWAWRQGRKWPAGVCYQVCMPIMWSPVHRDGRCCAVVWWEHYRKRRCWYLRSSVQNSLEYAALRLREKTSHVSRIWMNFFMFCSWWWAWRHIGICYDLGCEEGPGMNCWWKWYSM